MSPRCVQLVSCGVPGGGVGIVIVDPEGCTNRGSGVVGEIWVSGPSKARGYWGKAELSHETFQATLQGDDTEYLRTGDLGPLHGGELSVCGRVKGLIIVRGRNLYPQDIERTTGASHPALRPGCSAASGVGLEGEEQLVLVAEARGNPTHQGLQEAIQAVRAAVTTEHQIRCRAVLLLEGRTVPKTTSGKIQRRACKQGSLEWHETARDPREAKGSVCCPALCRPPADGASPSSATLCVVLLVQ